jgi:hypothetical protein
VVHPAHQLAVILRKRIEGTVREADLVGALFARLEAISRQGPLR